MVLIDDLRALPKGCRVILYGAGEFGKAFLLHLRRHRPDVDVVCFADTFKTGEHAGLRVISPQALANETLASNDEDIVIITAGDLPAVATTLEAVGKDRYFAVGPCLRMAAGAKNGVRFIHSLTEVPTDTAWTVVGTADSLDRLFTALDDSEVELKLLARLTLDEARAAGEELAPPLLILGSACHQALAESLGDLPSPLLVLDDPRLLDMDHLLREQIDCNLEIWGGGYREGDPLDPLSASKYHHFGWISSLHVIYLICIKPFVGAETTALEIGCGGGAWSRAIAACRPRELWCVDVLPSEETGFWEHVGRDPSVRYVQVDDFTCSSFPDGHFDYFFSFGCFCHLSPPAVLEYLTNLARKLKPGARGFLMVADYNKFNAAQQAWRHSLTRLVPPTLHEKMRGISSRLPVQFYDLNEDQVPRPGRWYHAGTDEVCAILSGLGMEIMDRDMGVNIRDPLIHFRKR